MIRESEPWKRALLADAAILRRWADKKPTERRSVLAERKIFTAAYALRKLMQANRLSSSFSEQAVSAVKLSSISSPKSLETPDNSDRNYDWASPLKHQISAPDLFDLIIHSFVFLEEIDDDGGRLIAFYVTSDRRKTSLFRVQLEDFLRLMELAGNDYPTETRRAWNEDQGIWVVWTGSGEMPDHVLQRFLKARKTWKG